ncbi:MAG: hypothetical protein J1F37_00340 [Oscillospiraceae bacterium]|nr:hypothetical protein [Oscillospiraceae bacterium]
MEQKKNNNRKKPKKNSNKKGGLSISLKTANKIRVISVILVILILVSIAAARISGVTVSMVSDGLSTVIAKIGAGPGFPYLTSGISTTDVSLANSDLVLLDDASVKVIDSTAKEISSIEHSFDHPMLETSSGRILLYDIGAKQFRAQSKTRVLFEKQTDYIILTAALGRDGSVAVATRADGAESMLTVYDKNHKEAFKWACAKEHIVSCDISDNGKKYAVAVLGVDNGSVYSKVYVFEKNKTEVYASFEYNDSALTEVKFLSNDKIIVFGNNVCEIIDGEEVSEKIDVSVNTPSRLYVSDNNTAVLVLSKYSSTTQKIIKVYNKSGKEMFTAEVTGIVKSVSTDGRYTAVLTDSQVCIFNMKGEMTGKAEITSDPIDVGVYSRRVYVFSSEGIFEYSSVKTDE